MKRRRYEDGTALVGRSPRDEGGYSGRGGERIFALNDAARGQWAGESSRCEDPAPTVGIAGRPLRGIASD